MNSRTHVILKKFIAFPLLILFLFTLLQPLSLAKADLIDYVDIHYYNGTGTIDDFENMYGSGVARVRA